jgi:hypothetical protein
MREQLNGVSGLAIPIIIIKWATAPLFLANVVSGWLFRKYGFLAALVMRFRSTWPGILFTAA